MASSQQQLNRALQGWSCLAIVVALLLPGCSRSPYPAGYPGAYPTAQIPGAPGQPSGAGASPGGPQSVFAQQQTAPQIIQLQQRITSLDADNRQLTAQVAQLQQQNQAVMGQKELMAQQLRDAVDQNKRLAATSQQYAEQARGMQASMSARGGARLTANNSLANAATGIQIPGAQVLQDGEVVRIRLAADQLFTPGSAVLTQSAGAQLDQVAAVLVQRFARQRVAVEGHTDAGQTYGGLGSPYKLAGDQAQAVMDQLVQRNRIPTQQLFIVNHGPNIPLADNRSEQGRSANRRIEIVVYPDSF